MKCMHYKGFVIPAVGDYETTVNLYPNSFFLDLLYSLDKGDFVDAIIRKEKDKIYRLRYRLQFGEYIQLKVIYQCVYKNYWFVAQRTEFKLHDYDEILNRYYKINDITIKETVSVFYKEEIGKLNSENPIVKKVVNIVQRALAGENFEFRIPFLEYKEYIPYQRIKNAILELRKLS